MKDLINRLLEKSPMKRIGFNGAIEVMEHPWLANVNWKKMQMQNYDVSLPFRFSYLSSSSLGSVNYTCRITSVPNLIPGIHYSSRLWAPRETGTSHIVLTYISPFCPIVTVCTQEAVSHGGLGQAQTAQAKRGPWYAHRAVTSQGI